MGPEPSNPYPGAAAALAAPLLRHLDPVFLGIEIGGGVGAFAASTCRIGCTGHTTRPANLTLLLAALAEVLGR